MQYINAEDTMKKAKNMRFKGYIISKKFRKQHNYCNSSITEGNIE